MLQTRQQARDELERQQQQQRDAEQALADKRARDEARCVPNTAAKRK